MVPDAGKQGQAVIRGGGGASGVRLLYLLDADHLIGTGAELGSPGNGITWLQSVQVSKVIPDAPVVPGDTAVAIPQAGVLEVARALG